MTHRIGIIGGDGIGPEVVAEALKVVDAAGVGYEPVAVRPRRRPLPARRRGAARRRPRGDPRARRGAPRRGRDARRAAGRDRARSAPAAAVRARPLRQLRPFVAGPSALNDGVDMIVVRENTEGTYAGEGGFLRKGTPHEVATQGSVNTRHRRRAVRPLRVRPRRGPAQRKHLTLVHKTNVLTFAGDLWERTFQRGRAPSTPTSTPRTTTSTPRASTSCRTRVATTSSSPTTSSATSSPTSAARSPGGIGRAASANLNPARTGPSLFEPVHGSAPDIAGHGQGRSAGRDRLGRDDARVPRRGRRGRASRDAPSRSPTTSPDPRPRSATRSPRLVA